MRANATEDIPVLNADAVYGLIAGACERIAFWDEYSFPRIERDALSELGNGVYSIKGCFYQDDLSALRIVMQKVCERTHSQVRYAFDEREEYGIPYVAFSWVLCIGDA